MIMSLSCSPGQDSDWRGVLSMELGLGTKATLEQEAFQSCVTPADTAGVILLRLPANSLKQ